MDRANAEVGLMSSARVSRAVTTLSMTAALIFVTVIVVGSSRAAFVSSTTNASNAVRVPVVELAHSPASLIFDLSNVGPGVTYQRCVTVNYIGDAEELGEVAVWGEVAGGHVDLGTYLDFKLERVGPGACGAAADGQPVWTYADEESPSVPGGSIAQFLSSYDSVASLSTKWIPQAGQPTSQQQFRLSVVVADDPDAQARAAWFRLFWRVVGT